MNEQLKVLIISGAADPAPLLVPWTLESLESSESTKCRHSEGPARHGAVCGLHTTAGQTPTTLKPVPPGAAWFVKTQFLARRTNLQEIRRSAYMKSRFEILQ